MYLPFASCYVHITLLTDEKKWIQTFSEQQVIITNKHFHPKTKDETNSGISALTNITNYPVKETSQGSE